MQPICWSDSWPDGAIVQAKTHNAKVFSSCPAIKAKAKEICTGIVANVDRILSETE